MVDVYLEDPNEQHVIVTDVVVSQPLICEKQHRTKSLSSAAARVTAKKARYLPNWTISAEDFKPLAFETYGGYAPETFEFLSKITKTIARGNDVLAGQLMWHMRERIAVAIWSAQVDIIYAINRKERAVCHPASADSGPPTPVGSPAPQPQVFPVTSGAVVQHDNGDDEILSVEDDDGSMGGEEEEEDDAMSDVVVDSSVGGGGSGASGANNNPDGLGGAGDGSLSSLFGGGHDSDVLSHVAV